MFSSCIHVCDTLVFVGRGGWGQKNYMYIVYSFIHFIY